MSIRKLAIVALTLAAVGVSTQPSKAAAPAPIIVAGGAGAGAAVVGGIVGFAVFAIAYDLYLKSIGVKSWDGVTPPKPKARTR